jgi:hypothetical protein
MKNLRYKMPDNNNSNIEDPKIETLPKEEPIIPKDTKPTIPKSKNNSPSLSDQIKKLLREKIDGGYELKDKNSYNELKKIIFDELKINKNSGNMIRTAIREVAIEKKIQISDLGFKNDKIGDMIVTVVKPEPTEIQTIQSNIQTQSTHSSIDALPKPDSSNKGSLPSNDSQTIEEEKQYMTGTAQKKLISSGLTKIIFPIYTALGIVELDDSELKQEAKIPKGQQVKKEFEELAGDIDEYLTENNIQLPALLNHLSIIISVFCVLILPVIKYKMFTQKQEPQPDYDDSADTVEVKA